MRRFIAQIFALISAISAGYGLKNPFIGASIYFGLAAIDISITVALEKK